MTTFLACLWVDVDNSHTMWVRLIAFWLVCVAAASACTAGGTVCDDAVAKLAGECGLGSNAALANGGDCKDLTECEADCVLESECDEITDKDADSGFFDCLSDC